MVLMSLKNENIEGALAIHGPGAEFGDYHSHCRKLWKAGKDPEFQAVCDKNAVDCVLTREEIARLLDWLDTEPKLKRYYQHYAQPCIRLAAELQLNGLFVTPGIFIELSKDFENGSIVRKVERKRKIITRETRADVDENTNGNLFKLFALFGRNECPGEFPTWYRSANLKPILRTGTPHKKLRRWDDAARCYLGIAPGKTSREHLAYLTDQAKTPRAKKIRKAYYDLTFLATEMKELKQVINQTPLDGGLTHPRYNFGGRGQSEEEGEPVHTGRWSARDWNPQKAADYVKVWVRSRWEQGVLVNTDAKAIEPRVAYEYSKDPVLLDWFGEEGIDGYVRASDVAFPGKGAKFRQEGKRVFLSWLFGAEWKTVWAQYNNDLRKAGKPASLSESQAKEMCNALAKELKIHHDWMESTWSDCKTHLMVESLAGRRRHLDEARSRDWKTRNRARNQAINFPIQSFANDINTVSALVLGWQWRGGLLCAMVHDSTLADCVSVISGARHVKRAHRVWKQIRKHVKEYLNVDLKMTYPVETEVGRYWKPMVKVEPNDQAWMENLDALLAKAA